MFQIGGTITGATLTMHPHDILSNVHIYDTVIHVAKGQVTVERCNLVNSVIHLPDGGQFGQYDPGEVEAR